MVALSTSGMFFAVYHSWIFVIVFFGVYVLHRGGIGDASHFREHLPALPH